MHTGSMCSEAPNLIVYFKFGYAVYVIAPEFLALPCFRTLFFPPSKRDASR